VVTRSDLTLLVAPSYAEALGVDEEEGRERVAQALARPGVAEDLYRGMTEALAAAKGPRTTEDELLDKLSARLPERRGRAKPAPSTPAIAAVMVRLNLEIGLAPESMRATLSGEKGQALLDAGLAALGAHLVKHLLR
jgi:hypothetical protein